MRSPSGDQIGYRALARCVSTGRGDPPLDSATKMLPSPPGMPPATTEAGNPVQYAIQRPSGENLGVRPHGVRTTGALSRPWSP